MSHNVMPNSFLIVVLTLSANPGKTQFVSALKSPVRLDVREFPEIKLRTPKRIRLPGSSRSRNNYERADEQVSAEQNSQAPATRSELGGKPKK